jgi:hypothetical protein
MQLEEELALRVQMLADEFSASRPLRFNMTPTSDTPGEQSGLTLEQSRAVFIGMLLLRSVAEQKHRHFPTCDCNAMRKVRVIWKAAAELTRILCLSASNQQRLRQLDWTVPQLMLAIARELTLLEQMLAKECRSCKNGDGPLVSLTMSCCLRLSGGLVSFFEEFYFSEIGTRLRTDHRSSLRMSNLVADIASALADGLEHSVSGPESICVTLPSSIGRNRRGYRDFIGGTPPRQSTKRLSSSSPRYAKAFTQGKDLNTVIFVRIDLVKMTYVKIRYWFYIVTTVGQGRQLYAMAFTQSRDLSSLVFDIIDSGCEVTTVGLDRQLSLLDLGLTRAHRSCVDGDGAVSVWTMFTPQLHMDLLEDSLVSAEFAPMVAYKITDKTR